MFALLLLRIVLAVFSRFSQMQALFKAVYNLFGTGDPDSVVYQRRSSIKVEAGLQP